MHKVFSFKVLLKRVLSSLVDDFTTRVAGVPSWRIKTSIKLLWMSPPAKRWDHRIHFF